MLHTQDETPHTATYDYKDFRGVGCAWLTYEGEFLDGVQTGQGILVLKNGEKYIGSFKDGVVDGFGTFVMCSGKNVVGKWSKGVLVKEY